MVPQIRINEVQTAIQGTKENDAKPVSVVLKHNYICIKVILSSKVQDFKANPENTQEICTSRRSTKHERGSEKACFHMISTIPVIPTTVMMATVRESDCNDPKENDLEQKMPQQQQQQHQNSFIHSFLHSFNRKVSPVMHLKNKTPSLP